VKLAALFLLLLEGCAVLDVVASKEAAIGCQIGDMISTRYALTNNANAFETNELGPYKINLAWIAMLLAIGDDWKKAPAPWRAAFTAFSCWPVPTNIKNGKQ